MYNGLLGREGLFLWYTDVSKQEHAVFIFRAEGGCRGCRMFLFALVYDAV
jgi:hypothetical protein